MGLNRSQLTGPEARPAYFISFSFLTLPVSLPGPHLPYQEATTGELSCCRKAFTGQTGV